MATKKVSEAFWREEEDQAALATDTFHEWFELLKKMDAGCTLADWPIGKEHHNFYKDAFLINSSKALFTYVMYRSESEQLKSVPPMDRFFAVTPKVVKRAITYFFNRFSETQHELELNVPKYLIIAAASIGSGKDWKMRIPAETSKGMSIPLDPKKTKPVNLKNNKRPDRKLHLYHNEGHIQTLIVEQPSEHRYQMHVYDCNKLHDPSPHCLVTSSIKYLYEEFGTDQLHVKLYPLLDMVTKY